MLAGPHGLHQSRSPCVLSTLLLSTNLFFTKHHDLHLPRTPQRNGSILFRRPLLPARPSDPGPSEPLCQCQQQYRRPPL
jgi:hypothetical protein